MIRVVTCPMPCADVYRIADCSETDGAADCRTQCFDPSNCAAHTDCGHDGTSDTYCDTARNCFECSYWVNVGLVPFRESIALTVVRSCP